MKNIEFNNHSSGKISPITLNAEPTDEYQTLTKSFVDSLSETNGIRQDMFIIFGDQDNEFDNIKLSNLVKNTVKSNSTTDNGLSNKNYVDDKLNKDTILRFKQTLQNYLKVSDGDDISNLNNTKKEQTVDTTIIKYP